MVFIPRPLADYDDWAECLGVMLLQFRAHDPVLDFDDWALIYGALLGAGVDTTKAEPRAQGTRTLPSVAQYRRGLLDLEELLADLEVWDAMLGDLWTGIAAHRCGGDWLAHLAAAATLGGTASAPLTRALVVLYEHVFGDSSDLDRLWSRHPDDPGATISASEHRAHARSLDAAISVQAERRGPVPVARVRRSGSMLLSPDSISLSGQRLFGDDLVDAAEQVRLTGGWPATVLATPYFGYRCVMLPTAITDSRVEFIDVIAGMPLTAVRADNTSTGWVIKGY